MESIEQEWNIQLKYMKSLVFFSGEYTIEMHDLIQDMGRYVVTMKMILENGEHRRPWCGDDQQYK